MIENTERLRLFTLQRDGMRLSTKRLPINPLNEPGDGMFTYAGHTSI
jgi:hypothetical protein